MSFADEPLHYPSRQRENFYERSCRHCGGAVPSGPLGVAFLMWDEHTAKNKWQAAHAGECLAAVEAKEPPLQPTPTGPIAAKQLQDRPASLEEVAEALEGPFQVPTAEQLAILMEEALANACEAIAADTADHFTRIVPGMIAEGIAMARPIAISVNKAPPVTIQRAHRALPHILTAVVAGASPTRPVKKRTRLRVPIRYSGVALTKRQAKSLSV